eukprot:TRINITY_DN4846_c1_g1_i1.p1 TRINITY_DN4846_c1_g1~~TRINITY_DN4846_c1_g1_i1.p1  ORF type:complete len:953 (+),score=293.87 TRINITY_DN4846_c1_g1_i1:58-2916(+)
MYQWKSRFQFFDREQIKEEAAQSLEKLVITCAASGQGRLILGDADGFLNFVEKDFQQVFSFPAFARSVNYVHQLKQLNYFVALGDDEEAISPTVKIWNTDKTDAKSGDPLLVRSIKILPATVVTAMAVSEDLTQIAIGLCNGLVVLIRGDIVREKNSKQVHLGSETGIPVTGLGFKEQDSALFVVTSDSVNVFHTNSRDMRLEVLDDTKGCGVGCCVMNDEQEMVIGRNEAVYFYESDGMGPCFGFEGDKKLLSWFRGYLVVVGQDPSNLKFNTFNIYDLKNKFIAYSETRFQNVTQVISEWGLIFVTTGDGKIYQLEEKDTQTKLETLFKRNLYDVAINLAHSQNYDAASIVDIFRRYGDHLYNKGEFDRAIAQYIRTIGNLEPSYVIRKFLDAPRIHNLTSYLQALHEKGLANADHTTLLFNCYTKLKDVKKLDEFIKTDSDVVFETETAIKACRQAGYYEHALYLAKKNEEHDWYLKILLEDVKRFNEALDYIATLDFFEAEKNLKKYGKALVTNIPEPTTNLLMKLCSDYQPTAKMPTLAASTSGSGQGHTPLSSSLPKQAPFSSSFPMDKDERSAKKVKAAPGEFIHIFVNQPEWLTRFLEFIVLKGTSSNLVYNTLLELYLRNEAGFTLPGAFNKDEQLQSKGWKPAVPHQVNEDKKARFDKAYNVLTNPESKYDDDHALVLCKIHDFKEGLLYIYEKLALYNEIVEYYMENNENENVIRACKKYSDRDPNLWVEVLTYFANKQEDCHKEIKEVLVYIDRDNLLPPLQVVQILSQRPIATLSLIKDYITKRLQLENTMIAEDARQIRNFQEDTKKMRAEIQELKTSAKIFQLNKCTYCGTALDLPAIHFLCMHSFHQRCLGENENECLVCGPQNKTIREIKRSMEENVGQHDQFFKQLEGSQDGFTTVSEYFGKGLLNRAALPSDGGSANMQKGRDRDMLLYRTDY